MPKRLKKPAADPNRAARALVDRLDGEEQPISPEQLSAYMRALGRKGGEASGAKRMENLSQDKRREIASKAARAMWEKRRAAEKKR